MKWVHVVVLVIWMSAVLVAGIGIVWQGAEENALRRQRGAFMKERRDLLTEQGRLHATLTMEGNLARVQAAIERQRLPLQPQPVQNGTSVQVLAEAQECLVASFLAQLVAQLLAPLVNPLAKELLG